VGEGDAAMGLPDDVAGGGLPFLPKKKSWGVTG